VATSTAFTGVVDRLTLCNSSTTSALTAYLRVVFFSGATGTSGGYFTLTLQ
jgi:hypothetical protein